MPLPDEIVDESAVLFRDVRLEHVDPEAHAAFVIARVLDYGTLRSVGALLRYYGPGRIRAFFREGGTDRVSQRTVPLWAAFLELTPDECIPRSSHRPNSLPRLSHLAVDAGAHVTRAGIAAFPDHVHVDFWT
jgi:hypothetical protein